MIGKDKEAALIIEFGKKREKEKGGADPFDAKERDPYEQEESETDFSDAGGVIGDELIEAVESGDGSEVWRVIVRAFHAHQEMCDADCPGEADDEDHGGF